MTTITKEWLQQTIAEFENTRDDIPFGLSDDDAKVLIVLKRALASLEAEPAGYHVIKECGKVGCSVATLEEAEKTRDFCRNSTNLVCTALCLCHCRTSISDYRCGRNNHCRYTPCRDAASSQKRNVGNIQFDELCVRGSYTSHPLSIRSACLSMLLIGLSPVDNKYRRNIFLLRAC
ncbi:hypothetical protein [Salmonella enterica]|uniref:hypothetical protein n=1 Tax=Salmonella enterica TaxID=28901 RepID=UPI001E54B5DC|nr:hypothetical protein [Salmonella enterica]